MKLGQLGTIVTGKTPSTKNKEYWNGTVPFITPKDIQDSKHIFKTGRYITAKGMGAVKGSQLPTGAICVSCIGNIGYVGMTSVPCVSNQQINSIIVNYENDRNFVYYLIKSLWFFFKSYEGQSTTLSILNKTQFSNIDVPVPPLPEQKIIADTLSALDDKIENNNRINHHLPSDKSDKSETESSPDIRRGRRASRIEARRHDSFARRSRFSVKGTTMLLKLTNALIEGSMT